MHLGLLPARGAVTDLGTQDRDKGGPRPRDRYVVQVSRRTQMKPDSSWRQLPEGRRPAVIADTELLKPKPDPKPRGNKPQLQGSEDACKGTVSAAGRFIHFHMQTPGVSEAQTLDSREKSGAPTSQLCAPIWA